MSREAVDVDEQLLGISNPEIRIWKREKLAVAFEAMGAGAGGPHSLGRSSSSGISFYYLEPAIESANLPVDDRLVNYLLSDLLREDSQWVMVVIFSGLLSQGLVIFQTCRDLSQVFPQT
ncbi:hypothetical protein BJ138DRAFT_1099691 [Hygrophoropsis aurantiaca]|uniref:Uncharacterized protein n=1 Tax=Hygrophoropsis aurantiaca TaxID=72124 RepID=A0ACB8AHX0_9AGAM|nr:hypothetical protein BJ138DRAFT_1099691 [Hygrophoropsis aurantiaca]